ncbi:plastocyanin/azurin family copper-binding protein [Synechococcus sp. H65.1]|uniref:plastocyanin/azurin family copper-binding protein n=1 Tax=unclassified Synechococcus TaxID=2626047 RepID=UPI0039C0DC49
MLRGLRYLLILSCCLWMLSGGLLWPAWGRDLSRQTPQDKTVELGTADNQLVFVPKELFFRNGNLYRLRLSNPSQLKHYFSAKDFADAVWTRKLEVAGVEIKGQIREIELKPGAAVEWQFIPLKSGVYSLVCTIPGHAEAGMIGQITIGD